MLRLTRSLIVLLSLALAGPALAGITGGTGATTQTIKTPPLSDSDSVIIPINVHIPTASAPWVGWSGALMSFHLLDGSEMDVLAVTPLPPFAAGILTTGGNILVAPGSPILSPFGPPSANLTSVPLSVNAFLPGTASLSGISALTSSSFTLATALFHAKNTTTLNNSDIDAVISLWNIYHVRSGFTSIFTTLDSSALLWVNSTITDIAQLHTTGPGYELPQVSGGLGGFTGHWLHITSPLTLHLTGIGSGYYATLARITNLGIEHANVPEPATGLLFGGGLLALSLSRYARRRRLSA